MDEWISMLFRVYARIFLKKGNTPHLLEISSDSFLPWQLDLDPKLFGLSLSLSFVS